MSGASNLKKDQHDLIRNISLKTRFPSGVETLEQKIRFLMWCNGPQTVPTLASKIDTPCTSVQSVIKQLVRQGLVVIKSDDAYGLGGTIACLYGLPE